MQSSIEILRSLATAVDFTISSRPELTEDLKHELRLKIDQIVELDTVRHFVPMLLSTMTTTISAMDIDLNYRKFIFELYCQLNNHFTNERFFNEALCATQNMSMSVLFAVSHNKLRSLPSTKLNQSERVFAMIILDKVGEFIPIGIARELERNVG